MRGNKQKVVWGGGLTTLKDRTSVREEDTVVNPVKSFPWRALLRRFSPACFLITAPQALYYWVPKGPPGATLLLPSTAGGWQGHPSVTIWPANYAASFLTTQHLRPWLQTHLWDHRNKTDIVIKQVPRIFWFPSAFQSYIGFLLPWWLRCKESACNAGDTGWIPVSGSSPGEGNSSSILA